MHRQHHGWNALRSKEGTPPGLGTALRTWFTAPPRRRGEVDKERVVSFLELFYDLVFVALVLQIAHTLAEDVSWSGLADFAVVFGMIWIAWFNGSLFHETHAREDGRARNSIFAQMFLLVALAVVAGHATEDTGVNFALTFAVLLAVLAWQWWSVRRHDDETAYRTLTMHYVLGLLGAIGIVLASVFVENEVRLLLWAFMVIVWVVAIVVQTLVSKGGPLGMRATESLAERFGLFTILVLGEVVFGVVDGMIASGSALLTLVTGLLALTVGFGFWWNYFDALGRRTPRRTTGAFLNWAIMHLPLTAAIAAAGSGMVSLIEHARDSSTPAATAWLLSGSSAALLVLLGILVATVDYRPARALLTRPIILALMVGAAASIVVGLLRPQAWLLALLLGLIHLATWLYAFALVSRIPGESVAQTSEAPTL